MLLQQKDKVRVILTKAHVILIKMQRTNPTKMEKIRKRYI